MIHMGVLPKKIADRLKSDSQKIMDLQIENANLKKELSVTGNALEELIGIVLGGDEIG